MKTVGASFLSKHIWHQLEETGETSFLQQFSTSQFWCFIGSDWIKASKKVVSIQGVSLSACSAVAAASLQRFLRLPERYFKDGLGR
jgi:hypothetical protein